MRRPSRGLVALCAAGICLCVAGLRGQDKPPAQDKVVPSDVPTVFRTETRVVVCNTTVVDKSGHLVTDLVRDNFAVFENGVAQKISDFKHEDVPVSLGLIIDNSGSMRSKRGGVEAASLALVRDSNPEDEVFVVNFNDEPFLDLPNKKNFTNNIGELEQALTRIDSRGGTAMRDAILYSIYHLREKASRDKKVLVVVTDGVDNASIVTQDNLIRTAQQSDVLLYAVGLLEEEDRGDAAKAKRELNGLAEATGGETYFPKDVSEVDHIAHVVAHDIRNQYTIQYTPSNTAMDGTYRQIKVTVNAPGHLAVRTRSGYYATTEQDKPGAKGTHFR